MLHGIFSLVKQIDFVEFKLMKQHCIKYNDIQKLYGEHFLV